MDITIQSYIGITAIVAQGVPTSSTFADIDKKLGRAPHNHLKQVWLDGRHLQPTHLTQICFCSILNKLLTLHRDGVRVVLFSLNNSTQRMLKILKLDKLFQQVATLEDAYMLIKQQYALEEQIL